MNLRVKSFLKIFMLIFILIFIYSVAIEPSLLIVKKYNINESGNLVKNDIVKTESESIKVVQISDTQIGSFYSTKNLKKVANKVNALNPDIIVFTGDLIDYSNKNPDIDEITAILSSMNARLGKFSVFGNHDYMYKLPRYYRQIMKNSNFNLLINENKKIKLADDKYINILGVDEILNGNPDIKYLENKTDKNNFNLLLAHEPDLVDMFSKDSMNLVLSGHSHGGQIRIPFKGALVTPPYGRKYTKGFYEVNGNHLYVSSGLGSTKLPFRFFNIPEIVEFNILI
ncbi:putative metallophosphoesterase [Clostridioides difficile]|nr:metallophosphatase [Clostridioides difficile]MCC0692533.1 metallophosphoesterase [Clostridioides sp. ZZV14-6387]MCI9978073.1 metallophosphoesterase [Clostridioides difficile]CZR99035.1 putative metallophosphoesterase [Clostridioides difficile]CZS09182.1 putative metallophosphoesterase [Clostridioides difficile]